jgi:hypothetical protein
VLTMNETTDRHGCAWSAVCSRAPRLPRLVPNVASAHFRFDRTGGNQLLCWPNVCVAVTADESCIGDLHRNGMVASLPEIWKRRSPALRFRGRSDCVILKSTARKRKP